MRWGKSARMYRERTDKFGTIRLYVMDDHVVISITYIAWAFVDSFLWSVNSCQITDVFQYRISVALSNSNVSYHCIMKDYLEISFCTCNSFSL